ncbi:MAG: peptidylprolyl isomerase [Aestuariivita sp.]|nr:peptidylprolyl isomerase [Aestuariivita sp.]
MFRLVLASFLFVNVAAAGIQINVDGQHTQGVIEIELFEDVAPAHSRRIKTLASQGFYDNVFFHRVIDGFMVQTGDGQFGKASDNNLDKAGTGGSELSNLKAEFSNIPFDRGVVGMARSQSPDSANSQFFIMFKANYHLNGDYTVIGRVVSGLDVLDDIKRGDLSTFNITGLPDVMTSVTVID